MRRLGKGLSELGLNELLNKSKRSDLSASEPTVNAGAFAYDKVHYLSVDILSPGEFQPRQHIDQAALAELADSIRAQGILQPLIVRAQPNNRYEIIAGERRWRAAQIANLDKVPAIIREISDQTAIAFGLIENIQRRDLNSLEEALALQRLLQDFNLTHDAVAQAVGKSRSAITNLLRLLQLNKDVQDLLAEGRLQKGHALVLLGLQGTVQSECANEIVDKTLSVRQTEELVQQKLRGMPEKFREIVAKHIYALEPQRSLAEKLGAQVVIRHNHQGKGKIVINYHSLDELAGILTHIQ